MKPSACLLSIAFVGCISVGHARDYEMADFGQRVPTDDELVQALTLPALSRSSALVQHGDINSQTRSADPPLEKAKIVLHGGMESPAPLQDSAQEPRRLVLRDDTDSETNAREKPEMTARKLPQGKQKAVSLQVQFNYNSAELTEASKQKLAVVASALNSPKLAHYKFRIEGHTDAVGSAKFNLGLSKRRAQSVANHLSEEYAVQPNRLRAIGKGMSELANPADPKASENRRVVIVNVGLL